MASQTPSFSQVGEFDETDGREAAELSTAFWDAPLDWQRNVLDVMLARGKRDKYRFSTVALSIPRQNGKSWVVRARCFYGMVASGESILYTCQHSDTADGMFKSFCEVFEDEDNEELSEVLKSVRKTNGQQAIYLRNGGSIRFTTRTNSLARGKTYDVLVYDEAQELTQGQLAASLPTISASRTKNTQVVYLGTPPEPESPGDVFPKMHDEVHEGKKKDVAWIEWGASEVGDVTDRSRWERFNPSFGDLITESAVANEAMSMDPDTFARERLGWFSPMHQFVAALDGDAWEACRTSLPPEDGKVTFGVKFTPDGKSCAIAGCKADEERGRAPYVELVDVIAMPQGMRRLVAFLTDRADTTAAVAIDGKAYSGLLANALRDNDVPLAEIVQATTSNVMTAAQTLQARIQDGTVEHYGQPELDRCVKGCAKRPIGTNGGWSYGDGQAPGAPVEAAALALWANLTTKRDPVEGGIFIW